MSLIRILKAFLASVMVMIVMVVTLTVIQVYQSEELVRVFSRISAKGAMRDFQDEKDMTMYSDGNGNMTSSYSSYLNWLGSTSEFGSISSYLNSNFSEGVTPMNFSLPYLDEEKLEIKFNEYLRLQIDNMQETENKNVFAVDNVVGKVKLLTKDIKNFNTSGFMFGTSSTFKDNTTGHIKLFDYDKYISYYVVYEVDYDLVFNIPLVRNMASEGRTSRNIDFFLTYELFN